MSAVVFVSRDWKADTGCFPHGSRMVDTGLLEGRVGAGRLTRNGCRPGGRLGTGGCRAAD